MDGLARRSMTPQGRLMIWCHRQVTEMAGECLARRTAFASAQFVDSSEEQSGSAFVGWLRGRSCMDAQMFGER